MTSVRRPSRLFLLGHPVVHSLSPRFQQAALEAAAIPVSYEARDVPPAQLASTLTELAASHGAGNVTLPHKFSVFQACAVHSDVARRTGAVNTFWHDDTGRLVGHNTDVVGVRSALLAVAPSRFRPSPDGAPHEPVRVVLLGAGGVAASVLVALAEFSHVSVQLVARTPERARAVLAQLGMDGSSASPVRVVTALDEAIAKADVVVNATPIGLRDDAMPVAPEALPNGSAVLDLVYKRGETAWVRACRARGHAAEDGLRMLVEQGAASFESWFGVAPDREAMWRVLEPRPLP